MTEIVLSDDQTQVILSAEMPVAVRDRTGRLWGYLRQSSFTAQEIEDVRKELASDQPRRTTSEVLTRLQSLER